MTDSERDVCERIAEAMGVYVPGSTRFHEACLPDFFSDPIAADLLMRWLGEHDYDWSMGTERGESFCVAYYAAVERGAGTVVGHHQLSPQWTRALAFAAGFAIEEAAGG